MFLYKECLFYNNCVSYVISIKFNGNQMFDSFGVYYFWNNELYW